MSGLQLVSKRPLKHTILGEYNVWSPASLQAPPETHDVKWHTPNLTDTASHSVKSDTPDLMDMGVTR